MLALVDGRVVFEVKLAFREDPGDAKRFEAMMERCGSRQETSEQEPQRGYQSASEQLGCYSLGETELMYVSRFSGNRHVLIVHWVYADGRLVGRPLLDAFESRFHEQVKKWRRQGLRLDRIEGARILLEDDKTMGLRLDARNPLKAMVADELPLKLGALTAYFLILVGLSCLPEGGLGQADRPARLSFGTALAIDALRIAIGILVLVVVNWIRWKCTRPAWRATLVP